MSEPNWRRPPGVAAGTWQYVQSRSIADRYDAFIADTPLAHLDLRCLEETFPRSGSNESILDLGCGTGRASIALANRSYRVIAIDLSQAMLRAMCEKSAYAAVADRVQPLRANLVELSCVADGSVDHAVCLFSTIGMIQGRDHRHSFLKHVHRAVRTGGNLLLHVHNRWSAIHEHRGLVKLAKSWWRSVCTPNHEFGDSTYAYRGLDRMFIHRFSRRELTADLHRSGWMVDTVIPLSINGDGRCDRGKVAGGYIVRARRK